MPCWLETGEQSMTDHSVSENLNNNAGGDATADKSKVTELIIAGVKIEEGRMVSHILETKKTYDQKFNEKEIRIASDEASSDSLSVVDHLEGDVQKQRSAIVDPHSRGYSASVSGRYNLAQQREIGSLRVHELNYQRSHSCRDSPIGPSRSLGLETKATQSVDGFPHEECTDNDKAERRLKRDRSTSYEDTGMLVNKRTVGCPVQDLSERRVHCTIDDQTARAFHSILNREYTEESTGARTIRQSGGKDRHSKVFTSKGPRDRRVRLSVSTAIQFYDVQDRLGYDQPSKAVDWLIKKAKFAIDELESLPTIGLQGFAASKRDLALPTARIPEPISGLSGLSASSFCTDGFACNSNEGSITNASAVARSNVAIDCSEESEGKGKEDSPARIISKQQHSGEAKSSAEEPLIRSASGSNLILNETQQDIDCVSPPRNANQDLETTHHKLPGVDDKLKSIELPVGFKLEASNSRQLRGKLANESMSNPHPRTLPISGQEFVMFGDYSTKDGGRPAARKVGADVLKLQDREPLNISSSEFSNSLQPYDHRFSYMADDSFPSRCVDVSKQVWFQDQPQLNFPLSTVVDFSKLVDRDSDQSQQLSSMSSFPLSPPLLRFQNKDLPSGTPNYATLQNYNRFSAGTTATRRDDESRPSYVHSLTMRSPEKMFTLGHQISGNCSVGESNYPGQYVGASLPPIRIAHAQNQAVYHPLTQNVSVLEDELLSSSGINLGAHHLFRNVPLRSPSPSLTTSSLNQPRTAQTAYATDPMNIPFDHKVLSATSGISVCVHDLEISRGMIQSSKAL